MQKTAEKTTAEKTDYQKFLTFNKKTQSHLGIVYFVNLFV